MEKSLSDNEEPPILKSPPRRRRSTFFMRRDSLVSQPETQESEPKEGVEQLKINEDLERYSRQLMHEKELWKKEVYDRRHKYHDLRQQFKLMANAPSRSRISYASLSNEDIEFLKGKHNISKLVNIQMEFHASVEATRHIYKRSVELDNVFVEYIENNINSINEQILENSTIEDEQILMNTDPH